MRVDLFYTYLNSILNSTYLIKTTFKHLILFPYINKFHNVYVY